MSKRKYQDTSHLFTFDEDAFDHQEVTAHVDRVSVDGRQVLREEHQFLIPPSPERLRPSHTHPRNGADENPYALDADMEICSGDANEGDVEEHDLSEYHPSRRVNQYFVSTVRGNFLTFVFDLHVYSRSKTRF